MTLLYNFEYEEAEEKMKRTDLNMKGLIPPHDLLSINPHEHYGFAVKCCGERRKILNKHISIH